ncbi:hypothetical protein H9P43_009443 [Blastocladiella emersonii ATCC 22665]|nr:hypothetical protein H9P43_009443 [Blastocladiella emersonii ATCC 22665]
MHQPGKQPKKASGAAPARRPPPPAPHAGPQAPVDARSFMPPPVAPGAPDAIAPPLKLAYNPATHGTIIPADYIRMLSEWLRLPVPTTSTALIYYYRFDRFRKDQKSLALNPELKAIDPLLFATTCVYLSTKTTDCNRKIRDVLNSAHRALNPHHGNLKIDSAYWKYRDSLLSAELVLLRSLKFELDVDLAYQPLIVYVRYLFNIHPPLSPEAEAAAEAKARLEAELAADNNNGRSHFSSSNSVPSSAASSPRIAIKSAGLTIKKRPASTDTNDLETNAAAIARAARHNARSVKVEPDIAIAAIDHDTPARAKHPISPDARCVFDIAWALVADSYLRSSATNYAAEDLALAAVWIALKLVANPGQLPVPTDYVMPPGPPDADGNPTPPAPRPSHVAIPARQAPGLDALCHKFRRSVQDVHSAVFWMIETHMAAPNGGGGGGGSGGAMAGSASASASSSGNGTPAAPGSGSASASRGPTPGRGGSGSDHRKQSLRASAAAAAGRGTRNGAPGAAVSKP